MFNMLWPSLIRHLLMSVRLLLCSAIYLSACFSMPHAHAENRFGFIVGNGKYQNMPTLTNPESDARLMTTTFRNLGFNLISLSDGTKDQFNRGLVDSLRLASSQNGPQIGSKLGIMYVAGHGVQIAGRNYLVPLEAKGWTSEGDVSREGIDIAELVRSVAAVWPNTFLFLFDICRNNPFADQAALAGRGLAPMRAADYIGTRLTDPISSLDKPTNFYISFSTQPGQQALDGVGGNKNSPYAEALAEFLGKPNSTVRDILTNVQHRVETVTAGSQSPWFDGPTEAPTAR